MAKISIDVEELKKGLMGQAMLAKSQLTEFAKKAQKDLEETVEKVKSQEKVRELMNNPKVQELTKKLAAASVQLEKTFSKNASSLLEEVKARVNRATLPKTSAKADKAPKKSKKSSAQTEE